MSFSARLKGLYLRFFSSPGSDRILYRTIHKIKPRSIVEIGMSSTSRSRLLIEQSQFALGDQKVSLTVIDLFDGRPPNLPPLKLIETHRILCKTGATVKLVPGEENSTLPRIANSLQNTDLVLISSSSDLRNQVQLWFYLPRMLGERGQVLQQVTLENGRKQWRELTGKQILSLNQTAQDSKLRSVA